MKILIKIYFYYNDSVIKIIILQLLLLISGDHHFAVDWNGVKTIYYLK